MHRNRPIQACKKFTCLSRFRSISSSFARSITLQQPAANMTSGETSVLFKYTSGRWIYNEQIRLRERERFFNVSELQRLAAAAVERSFEDVLPIEKLGEGAANRAFVIRFRDGFKLVARVPYSSIEPRHLVVASEAATMTFLHSKGMPVPRIYGYSATAENPAGTEYIMMEFSPGRELNVVWSDIDDKDRLSFARSLVDVEARMFSFRLPASGGLYFFRDLSANDKKFPVDPDDVGHPDSLYVGPSTSLDLWYGKRSELDVERGPHVEVEAVLNAGAEKESRYLKRYGRPLYPFDRMRREIFNLEKQLPSIHLDSLRKYLCVSKHLTPHDQPGLLRPIIRHPDLRPSNIFVSDEYKITSLIDWQSSNILPLYLQSGIPNDLDNSRDSVSKSLETPCLPEGSGLSEDEWLQELETFTRRQLHHFYMTETIEKNPLHFKALKYPFLIGRRKIFQLASAPWQGDNVPLRSSLMFVRQHWQHFCNLQEASCPITFTEEEEREFFRLDKEEQDAEEQLEATNAMLGIGPEGWVSNENYENAKAAISRMKAMCWDQAENEMERTAVKDHWIYDDMDEDEYL